MKALLAALVGAGVWVAIKEHGYTYSAPNYDASGKPIPGSGSAAVGTLSYHMPEIAGVLAAGATYAAIK